MAQLVKAGFDLYRSRPGIEKDRVRYGPQVRSPDFRIGHHDVARRRDRLHLGTRPLVRCLYATC